MKLYILLFLAVVNKGISTYRPSEESPCEMVNMEAICHSKDLHHIPPELHPNVNKIDFSGNQIQNIPLKPLSFYTSLQHLYFNSNQISFIEQGVFAHMTSLVEINLAHNRLDRFIQHRTRGVGLLPNVATLDLSHNSLYNGMTEYFTHEAPSLQYLSLAENSITLISRRTFQGSPALVEVDLHSNIIMEIEEGAFEALLNLSKLNLSMNSITCIADFSLRQLQILDLSRNSIESFHTTESEEEFNMTWLDLSENKLMYFPTFPQVNKLVFLNLSKNLIQLSAESPRDSVDYMERDWLGAPFHNLDQNQHRNKSEAPFHILDQNQHRNKSALSLPQLSYLDLSYNEIKSIPTEFFDSMFSLQFLNLSKNCLQTFSINHDSALISLTVLDLSFNALQSLVLDASTLLDLQELYIQSNHLQALPFDIFARLPRIKLLHLQNNNISLCSMYSGLVKQRLAGEENGCISFVDYPTLQYLYLADNMLRSLPKYTFYKTSLIVLDLSINPGLKIEAKALSGLENSLEYLQLHGNSITDLNIDLPYFSVLKYLNLSENQLSWLPKWGQDASLEVLDLRNNRFSTLEKSNILALEPSLKSLYLSGNPLSCCENVWLSAMIQNKNVELPNAEQITCQYSKSFGFQEEISISNIKPQDCEKEDLKKINLLIILTFALVLIVIIIGVCSFCWFRRERFGQQFKA
ncbi:leucine-rich repeat-containing protein 32 isoform X2 [Alligator sinensis]|nr:leucine-rich repeat-containing protein 32 isoform X2 [Alligator sinensis]XP_025057849.1 leucine-rich repeat-containing protein 32 isoform X2 [Alligator sinensis]XP_025057851.1 leucine-rich repeat-containing protein 32 isoform X2 [Alligator sinensis]XP_025057852.1 leucine-rich repeat-containing protein 32 isoform X2 [Alligator sinensis]